MKVGPIAHLRWLTLGCRILRYYVSLDEPSPIVKVLVHFCLTVYFPTWFDNKLKYQITNGSKHLFSLLKKINNLSNEEIREVALDAEQKNKCFAYPEKLFIAMFEDGDEQIRMAVTKKLVSCSAAKESFISERQSSPIRLFRVPTINVKADVYYQ